MAEPQPSRRFATCATGWNMPCLRIPGRLRAPVPDRCGRLDLGGKIWRLVAPFNRRHKRALANLERAFPEKTPEEREQIALAHVGESRPRHDRDHEYRPHPEGAGPAARHQRPLSSAATRRRWGRCLIVTMHMGNWELGMWPVMLAGVNPAGVYRLVKNPYVDRYLRAQRKASIPEACSAAAAPRARTKAEDRASDHGLCAPGRAARLHLRPLRRARHRGAVLRLSGQEHADRGDDRAAGRRAHLDRPLHPHRQARLLRCQRERAPHPRTNNQAEDIRTITAAIQRHFEVWIRENPEQFMWSNRRWF